MWIFQKWCAHTIKFNVVNMQKLIETIRVSANSKLIIMLNYN